MRTGLTDGRNGGTAGWRSRVFAAGTAVVLAQVIGCGSGMPARVVAPDLRPQEVAADILQTADANKDGCLTGPELAQVPGVKALRVALDLDGDHRVCADEIEAWIARIVESKVAVGSGVFWLRQGGLPLANVHVKLVPDPAMAGRIQAAEGMSDVDGRVDPTIPGSKYHGVNFGLYRVEVTGIGLDGNPLPAKYNTSTTLGIGFGGIANVLDFEPTVVLD